MIITIPERYKEAFKKYCHKHQVKQSAVLEQIFRVGLKDLLENGFTINNRAVLSFERYLSANLNEVPIEDEKELIKKYAAQAAWHGTQVYREWCDRQINDRPDIAPILEKLESEMMKAAIQADLGKLKIPKQPE